MTFSQLENNFWRVLPYVVLALVLFAIFAIRTRDAKVLREYKKTIHEYELLTDSLNRHIVIVENQIAGYEQSIANLENERTNLEKKLKQVKQKYEKEYSHIADAGTDWNIEFLSAFLSEENHD